jgi:predicted Ser/Thr protein kinase
MSSPGPLPTAFGRYQVLEELGAGAMGVVYLCVDPRLNRPVAIKVMRESEFMTPSEREQYEGRFRHEAEAAGRLTHPDIVQVYDVGPSWMVMEFLEGQSLSQLLKRGERFSVRQVLDMVMRVADAVDYAHRHGIIHRDIKPANVMLTDDGGVKVMDFGVARLEHSTLTALGTVVGSVRYMAPEQMMGERVDGRADVFSVAAVAYELLTGRAPFPGKTITEVVSRVVHGAHVPPQNADGRLPAALNGVFARAFAPRPADRYARALDFARDLQAAAEPALDLQVAHGSETGASSRTEVVASTATPAPTLAAPPRHSPAPAPDVLETVILDGAGFRGRLLLEVQPEDALAEVDGQCVAVPREGLEVAPGLHFLRLRREGHYEVSCVFEASTAQPVLLLTAVLPPRPSREPALAFPPPGRDVAPPLRTAGSWPLSVVREAAPFARGIALVDVYLGEAGEVLKVEAVEGESPLARALAEAIRGWRFRPATRDGRPVPARLRVQHVFTS